LLEHGLPHEPRRSEHASENRAPLPPSSAVESCSSSAEGVPAPPFAALGEPARALVGLAGEVLVVGPAALGDPAAAAGDPATPGAGARGPSGLCALAGPVDLELESPQPSTKQARSTEVQVLDLFPIYPFACQPVRQSGVRSGRPPGPALGPAAGALFHGRCNNTSRRNGLVQSLSIRDAAGERQRSDFRRCTRGSPAKWTSASAHARPLLHPCAAHLSRSRQCVRNCATPQRELMSR
jgi:hypothetical protein